MMGRMSVAALATLVVSCLPIGVVCLWPQPASMLLGTSTRSLAPNFSIDIPDSLKGDADMNGACRRALGRIQALALEPYVVDRGGSYRNSIKASSSLEKLTIEIGSDPSSATFGIHYSDAQAPNTSILAFNQDDSIRHQKRNHRPGSISALSLQPLEKIDESYKLHIPSDGNDATLQASNALGALRGLATFTQLVYRLSNDDTLFLPDLPISISDKAAFPYRGLLLDTARNYLPVSSIKKTIDVMETVKMNQLHWHLTDSQSWPLALETKGLDVLAKKGSYGRGEVYDKDTIAHLVSYAAKRGINLNPEIDMPGHMNAGVVDYQKRGDLITCNNKPDWTNWANEPPSGHLDIRKSEATQFVEDVFNELVTYFPGPYVSTGNDEIQPHCFGLAADDKAGMDKLLAPFVDTIHTHLTELKKTPMVWEEALINFPETGRKLKAGTLVEAWVANTSAAEILKARPDVNVILAPTDYFYLDCGIGGWLSNVPDGQSWCSFVTWQKQYSFDPFFGTADVVNAKDRIKGGESCAWAEQIDSGNLDSILWPRAASGAEVFWTGAEYTLNDKKEKRSLLQAEPRMHEIRGRIRAMGVMATAMQPFWCVLRPGQCGQGGNPNAV